MVFRCVFYKNCVQMHGAIVMYIFAGQYRSMYTHVPDVVIDMKMIYIEIL